MSAVNWHRVLFISVFWLSFYTGCTPHVLKTQSPNPDGREVEIHTASVLVLADGYPLKTAFGTLVPDHYAVVPCPNRGGIVVCELQYETGHATMQIDADGYASRAWTFELAPVNMHWDPVELLRRVHPLPRLRAAL